MLLTLSFSTALLRAQDLGSIATSLKAHEFDAAVTQSKQALAADPGNFRVWTLQGLAFSGLHKDAEGLAAFRHALTLSPKYLPALEGEGELEFKTHNPAAPTTLGRLLSIRPNDPVANAMLGSLSYEHKDCPAAVAHYRQGGDIVRTQPRALQQFGSCLMQIREAEEAVSVFEQWVQVDPGNGIAQYALAESQLAAKLPQQALSTFAAIHDSRVPQNKIAEETSSAYEMLRDTPHAVETLRSAILRDPENEDLYISFASLCLEHRSYDVGVKFLDAGIRELPGSYRLRVTRGILYVQQGNYEGASRDFEKGEQLDPAHSFGSMAEGLSQLQQSKLDQALATTEAELRKNPGDSFLYYLKAETLRRQGVNPGTAAFDQALHAAQRAVVLSPHFPLAQDLLGVLYQKNGNDELASKAFQAALRDDPLDQSALYHMLAVARKTGQSTMVPELMKRLADAKQQTQKEDVQASRYRIIDDAKDRGETQNSQLP